MTAIEAYRWHRQYAQKWTEPRPAPLVMSDKEVLDWLDEYADSVTQKPATKQTVRTFTIECEFITPTVGKSLREAVCLAAAKLEEANS